MGIPWPWTTLDEWRASCCPVLTENPSDVDIAARDVSLQISKQFCISFQWKSTTQNRQKMMSKFGGDRLCDGLERRRQWLVCRPPRNLKMKEIEDKQNSTNFRLVNLNRVLKQKTFFCRECINFFERKKEADSIVCSSLNAPSFGGLSLSKGKEEALLLKRLPKTKPYAKTKWKRFWTRINPKYWTFLKRIKTKSFSMRFDTIEKVSIRK